MIGWLFVSAVLGSIATLVAIASTRGVEDVGLDEGRSRENCEIAIWLFEVDEDDPISVIVNESTGGLGFSHVALDACEEDEQGRPLLIDAQMGEGVKRVHAERYDGRRRVRIYLTGATGWEIRGCARARVGSHFDAIAFLWPEERQKAGVVCSHYLYTCFPRWLRERVDAARSPGDRGAVSPNQIARAFGIRGPGDGDREI